MPVAVKVTDCPLAADGVVGVILMLDRVAVAATTVILAAGEAMPFMDAMMVVNPAPTPVATPVFLPTLVIAGLVETQLTEVVISAVAPSE